MLSTLCFRKCRHFIVRALRLANVHALPIRGEWDKWRILLSASWCAALCNAYYICNINVITNILWVYSEWRCYNDKCACMSKSMPVEMPSLVTFVGTSYRCLEWIITICYSQQSRRAQSHRQSRRFSLSISIMSSSAGYFTQKNPSFTATVISAMDWMESIP